MPVSSIARSTNYEQSPAEGWPLWCARQVEQANFVLVACTETYLRRFRAEEAPHKGLGGTWEGHIITQELYNGQGRNPKFIPIALRGEDAEFIPLPLQSATLYQLDDAYDALYRRLTNQPLTPRPGVGTVTPKPPRQPIPQNVDTLWQVRHPRNPVFTGRDKILTDLRQALEKRRTAALSGLGGVGKTQTAIEYAYRYRDSGSLAVAARLCVGYGSRFSILVTIFRKPDNPYWLFISYS